MELEISILRAMDADNQPAGKGRDPPQELPFPRFILFQSNFIITHFFYFNLHLHFKIQMQQIVCTDKRKKLYIYFFGQKRLSLCFKCV